MVACDIMDYERRRFTTVAANKQALNRTVKIKFRGVKMLQSSPFYENLASCVYIETTLIPSDTITKGIISQITRLVNNK